MKHKTLRPGDYAPETGEPMLSLEELIKEIEAYKPLWQPALRVQDRLRMQGQARSASKQSNTESILRIWGI